MYLLLHLLLHLLRIWHQTIFQLTFEGDELMFAEEGDHFGFAWNNKGVISFDILDEEDTGNYCNYEIYPEIGDEIELNMNEDSDREYSIQIKLCRKL